MRLLRPRDEHQHLLPRPAILHQRLRPHVRLQGLVSGLMLLGPDGLETYKDAHSVLNAVLAVLNQLAHDLADRRVNRFFLLTRRTHTSDQRRVMKPGQVWLPPR